MHENRKGEQGPVPFRTGRMFSVGSHWYFATREGDQGPFLTREQAEAEVARYVRNKANRKQKLEMGDD